MYERYRQTLLNSLLLSLCIASLVPSAAASAVDADRLRALQEMYGSLQSLSFTFSQQTSSGGRTRSGHGDAVLVRPGQAAQQDRFRLNDVIMRWNYAGPDRQVILNDGTTLTIYTVNDKQALVTPADDLEGDLTFALFSGKRQVVEEFQILPPAPANTSDSTEMLESAVLVPRQPHPQIQSIQIWFTSGLIIQRLLLTDHFDTLTDLVFTDVALNPISAEDTTAVQQILELNLPPDTEIISQ